MNEVEISLKGLIFYILKHWKSIIVAMILCAMLVCGIQMLRKEPPVEPVPETVEEPEIAEPVEVVEPLSDSEIEYVQSIYNYVQGLRQVNESRGNSFIARIDPQNVYKKELTYMIVVKNSDYIEGIEQAYKSVLTGTDCITFISEATGIQTFDIAETVRFIQGSLRDVTTTTASFTIQILSDDEDKIQKITDAIESFLKDKYETLCESGFAHELVLVNEGAFNGFDSDILIKQLTLLQEQQSRSRTIVDSENSLKDPQKIYYECLVNGTEYTVPEAVVTEVPVSETVEEETIQTSTPEKRRISPKYILAGLLLGAFLMCGLYTAIYILANKLDEDDDVERVFNLSFLGIITGQDYNQVLYKLRHFGKRTFDFEDSVKLVSTRISMIAQKENVNSIGIIGCSIDKYTRKASDEIVKLLKNKGIEALIINDPLYDPLSVEALKEISHAILLEKTDVTYRTEVWNERELAENLGVKIEGIVLAG